MDKSPTAMPATETSTALKEVTRSATAVTKSATKRYDAPDRCVVFVVDRVIQPKFVQTSSLSLRMKLTRVTVTGTKFSAERNKRPSSAMHQENPPTSLVRRIVVRFLGRWGHLSVICGNGSSCRMPLSSTGMINYR